MGRRVPPSRSRNQCSSHRTSGCLRCTAPCLGSQGQGQGQGQRVPRSGEVVIDVDRMAEFWNVDGDELEGQIEVRCLSFARSGSSVFCDPFSCFRFSFLLFPPSSFLPFLPSCLFFLPLLSFFLPVLSFFLPLCRLFESAYPTAPMQSPAAASTEHLKLAAAALAMAEVAAVVAALALAVAGVLPREGWRPAGSSLITSSLSGCSTR